MNRRELLAMLVDLERIDEAPAYLIVRRRPWHRAIAIVPIPAGMNPEGQAAEAALAGWTVQVVRYRPDEEDLEPFEPNPWWVRSILLLILALVAGAAVALLR